MIRFFVLSLLSTTLLCAQPFRWTREQMIHFTPENPFERFPDGRPKVPDELLEKVKGLSIEEAWGILVNKGYTHQHSKHHADKHHGVRKGPQRMRKYLKFGGSDVGHFASGINIE